MMCTEKCSIADQMYGVAYYFDYVNFSTCKLY